MKAISGSSGTRDDAILSTRLNAFLRQVPFARTEDAGGQGLGEQWAKLYRRLPDLLAPIRSKGVGKDQGKRHTGMSVGAGWLKSDGFFPGVNGVIILLWIGCNECEEERGNSVSLR